MTERENLNPNYLKYLYQTDNPYLEKLLYFGSLVRACASEKFPQINFCPSSSQDPKDFFHFSQLISNPYQFNIDSSQNGLSGAYFSSKDTSYNVCVSNNSDLSSQADLISSFSIQKDPSLSQFTFISGDGKGKTTLALGFAIQTLLGKGNVVSFHWFKNPGFGDGISEFNFPSILKNPESFLMLTENSGFLLPHSSDKELKNHQNSAQGFISRVTKYILESNFQLIILDEILDALSLNLVDKKQVFNLIILGKKYHKNLIFTGRSILPSLLSETESVNSAIYIKKVKHPYDNGILAIKGLDY